MNDIALQTLEHCHGRGWSFTPLKGKRPFMKAWQTAPRPDLETVLSWAARGNIGLRTGKPSGIAVVDIDPGADMSQLNLPETTEVSTGRGRHLYYSTTKPIKNQAGKIAPHVDLRGDGGQVVFPGSIHPETKTEYVFTKPPWTTLAPLPEWIYALGDSAPAPDEGRTADPAAPAMPAAPRASRTGNPAAYARAAFKLEFQKVCSAVSGNRNHTLNQAAFNLGQFIGANVLARSDVEASLLEAAQSAGLSATEASATITSGLNAGVLKPRDVSQADAATATPPRAENYVLAPGSHKTDTGDYVEQSSKTFATQIIDRLPKNTIYRKAHLPGEVRGEDGERYWDQLDSNGMRLVIDHNLQVRAWVKSRNSDERFLTFKPCARDMAGLAIAEARIHSKIRDLDLLVPYPFYTPDWTLASPGWSASLFYDRPPALRGLKPEKHIETIHETLEDLVADFPFASEADRQNYFGLLLTPIIAPAIGGNRPLHLIDATLARTGKSKLAGDVLGGIMLGHQTPTLQMAGGRNSDEERDKRLLALLLTGATIAHFDNLPKRKFDSASLASFLTSEYYQGRILGASKVPTLKNNLTMVASGNKIECSEEIAKRTIPIMLQPHDNAPEDRQDFQHPDLKEHIKSTRQAALACLLGMVENWIERGRPQHKKRLGGFEAWSGVIGGILSSNGMNQWRTNTALWRNSANYEEKELEAFVMTWFNQKGNTHVRAAELLSIVETDDFFDYIQGKPTARARATAFGIFLRRLVNRPVRNWVIKSKGVSASTEYWLE